MNDIRSKIKGQEAKVRKLERELENYSLKTDYVIIAGKDYVYYRNLRKQLNREREKLEALKAKLKGSAA